ncbi:hypothetical protein ACLFLH_00730 [Mammaliicoccus sciuri]|uniref:hypothetical protein n=1 Tax=Mammaliicoccus sciuri TaxID=1296 RepID=UPI00397D35E2
MPTNQTIYKMLLSCPSDLDKYYELIKSKLEEINKILSSAYNSRIDIVYWNKDVYPESGDTPQNIINKQIVKDCDFLVSMFWTRFGTPTEKYDSGTEEEIIEAISEQKQVFLYFSNEPISPDRLNQDEYEKVNKFKSNISDKAYYNSFDSEDEFLGKFQIHIMAYFDNLIKRGNSSFNDCKIKLMMNDNGVLDDNFQLIEFNKIDKVLEKKREGIVNILDEVDSLSEENLTMETKEKNKNSLSTLTNNYGLSGVLSSENGVYNFVLNEEYINIIKDFAYKINYKIGDNFFDLGDLKEKIHNNFLGSNTYDYIGNEASKKKLNKIKEVTYSIYKYNEEKEVLKSLNSYKFLSLCLTNFKGKFEKDIDIKLYFPKNIISLISDIPIPGNEIIESYENFAMSIFKPKTSSSISIFPDYTFKSYEPYLYKNDIERAIDNYKNDIDVLMEYKVYYEDDFDVLVLEVKEMKPNIALNFPSLLPLKIDKNYGNLEIKYKINTRDTSEIIEGMLTINNT